MDFCGLPWAMMKAIWWAFLVEADGLLVDVDERIVWPTRGGVRLTGVAFSSCGYMTPEEKSLH